MDGKIKRVLCGDMPKPMSLSWEHCESPQESTPSIIAEMHGKIL